MSIAEALNANRACSAPWIKDAVLRPVTLEAPKLRAHSWVEEDDGGHCCSVCEVSVDDRFVKDSGVSEVTTATSLDIALHWWTQAHPRSEVSRLVLRCPAV